MTTETTILDDRVVSEIESRPWFWPAHDEWGETPPSSRHVIVTVAERDALCRTVKHLREQDELWEIRFNEALKRYRAVEDDLQCQIERLRAEAKDAADSERQAILNAIEHSQRLCTHRAQDNSKTGEYRLMMEHFAEAGRQIAEMITEKRYQDLARPINQTEP